MKLGYKCRIFPAQFNEQHKNGSENGIEKTKKQTFHYQQV